MIAIRKIILSVAFLAVCMSGTGCFFTRATLDHLGETRWRYSTYSTALSPDESEIVTTYRKHTEHDCWPFLNAYHVTWNTNSFVEIRTPVEDPDDVKVNPNQYVQPLFGEQRSSTGPVGYCWKALWLPSAFVTDVVLLPVYGVVLCIWSKEMLDAFSIQ